MSEKLQSKQAVGKSPLLSAPIPGLMRKIAIPVSVGAFFNTMFNVVDTFYGGLISDQALAALSLSFPIYFIIIALGFGFSQGGTALMGNALGRGDDELAKKYAVQGLLFGVLMSVLTTVIIISLAPTIFRSLGATDEAYLTMALDYINPIFYGAIFFITALMLQAILNTLGHTKPGRNFLIGGFLLNLLIDPWFIFGGFGLPAMGITGIALATIFVQFLGCVYLSFEVFKTDLISWETIRANWIPMPKLFRDIINQGFPNTVDMMGVSLGFFVLTYYVSQFGQDAVAAMGAASRIEQIFLLPMLGLNIAVLSLVARNNGANQFDRVQTTFWTSLRYGSLLMLITTVLAIIAARPLMQLFSDDPFIIETGVNFVRIRSFGLIPNAIFFMSASAMRGVERPIPALIMNLFRFVLIPLILIYIFVVQLDYGLTAIWVTSTSAFFLMAVAGFWAARRILPTA